MKKGKKPTCPRQVSVSFLNLTSKRECEYHSQAGWTNVSTSFRSLLLVVALLELTPKIIRNSVAKTDHPGCCALVSLVNIIIVIQPET